MGDNMKKITINDKEYEVVENYNDAIDVELLQEKITDYFDGFDYIVGDWAYGKLRLKGFYDKTNKFVKNFNNIDNVDDYIENSCAYGCKHFILEKVKQKGIEKEN